MSSTFECFAYEYPGSGEGYDPWMLEQPLVSGLPFGYGLNPASRETNVGFVTVAVVGDALQVALREFAWHGSGSEFILSHGRSYCSTMRKGGRPGVLGPGWVLPDLPFLVVNYDASRGQRVGVVGDLGAVVWFVEDALGGWTALPGHVGVLEHDTVDQSYRFSADGTTVWIFHNHESEMPRQVRGRLKRLEMEGVGKGKVQYGFNDEVVRTSWRDADGYEVAFVYDYGRSAVEVSRLTRVSLEVEGSAQQRVCYRYLSCASERGGKLGGSAYECLVEGQWMLQRSLTYWYGTDGALIAVEVKEGDNLNDSSLEFSRNRYKVTYDKHHKVKWIHHEGDGQGPIFLD